MAPAGSAFHNPPRPNQPLRCVAVVEELLHHHLGGDAGVAGENVLACVCDFKRTLWDGIRRSWKATTGDFPAASILP